MIIKLDPSRVLYKRMSGPLPFGIIVPHCYACLTFSLLSLQPFSLLPFFVPRNLSRLFFYYIQSFRVSDYFVFCQFEPSIIDLLIFQKVACESFSMQKRQKSENKPFGQFTGKDSSKSSIGLRQFTLLFQLVEQYITDFEAKNDINESSERVVYRKDERLERIQKINWFIEQIELKTILEETHKIDYLIESLQIIKKIKTISTKHDIETRSKRLSVSSQLKAIQQVEETVLHNMAEIILLKMSPAKRTLNNVIQFIGVILEQIFEYQPQEQKGKQGDKQKTKKNFRKGGRDMPNIQISLSSGNKIQLLWFLVFRILQKNLQDVARLHRNELKEKAQITLFDIYEKYVNRYISEVIQRLILDQFQELNLFKQLLRTAVHTVSEFELPIVPFILKKLHKIVQQKFKIYYTVSFSKQASSKVNSKDPYSLDSLSIFLDLIDVNSYTKLLHFEPSRQMVTVSGVCSYCGVTRVTSVERLLYQKISIKISQHQNFVVTVCEECCQNIGVQPSDEINIMVFAPLIMSYFWKESEGNHRVNSIKDALRAYLCYQGLNTQGKKGVKGKKNKAQEISVSDKVAMNNAQQSVSTSFLQQIYNVFVFLHCHLSTKDILTNIFQILMIYWNSKDQKIRQKSIKLFSRSSIMNFVFIRRHEGEQSIKREVFQLKDKMIKSLQYRLRDNQNSVTITSLECLTEIFRKGSFQAKERELFYELMLKQVQSQGLNQHICKSLQLIAKMLSKFNSNHMSVNQSISYLRCYLKTFTFTISMIEQNEEAEQGHSFAFNEQISKLLALVLIQLPAICQEEKTHEEKTVFLQQARTFLNNKGVLLECWEQIDQKLLIYLFSTVILSPFIIKSLPYFSSKTIKNILLLTDSADCTPQTLYFVRSNLIQAIDMVYQDIITMNEEIFFRKKRQSSRYQTRGNLQTIADFVNSSDFIEVLLDNRIEEGNGKGRNNCKLKLLNKLLYSCNINALLTGKRQLLKYMTIWQKTKRKSLCSVLDPIIVSSSVEKQLGILSQTLLQLIKSSQYQILQIQAQLIINIKVFLGQGQNLRDCVLGVYQRYCIKFYDKYIACKETFRVHQNNNTYKELVNTYLALNRCFYITTVLVTNYEKYLLCDSKMDQFYQKELSSMVDGHKQTKMSTYDEKDNQQNVTTSSIFIRVYLMTIQILDNSDKSIKGDPQLMELYKQFMLFLKHFWEVHPKIIFSEVKLRAVLSEIDEKSPQGFTLIKSMYKLFESLLPSQNLQILIFIRDNFAKRFHALMRSSEFCQDNEFLESCFSIVFFLLKSGMQGLYGYNKYVFYGLLADSPKINYISMKLLKEIYTKEASEKILFVNLQESLGFAYQSLFERRQEQGQNFKEIILNERQKEHIKVLSELTKKKGNVFLVKDKKEIKMKTTFAKRIGQLLSSDLNIIKTKPSFTMFVLTLLKHQKVLDYCELIQLLITLNKHVTVHNLYVEGLLDQLKVNDPKALHDFVQKSNIILAYRALVSCLAYLSKYQQTALMIRNYDIFFDQKSTPYTELEEVIKLSFLAKELTTLEKVELIEQDINVFLEIILGELQVQEAKSTNNDSKDKLNEINRAEKATNKMRGGGGKGKKGKSQAKKKKNEGLSVSVDRFKMEESVNETDIDIKVNYNTRMRTRQSKNNSISLNNDV